MWTLPAFAPIYGNYEQEFLIRMTAIVRGIFQSMSYQDALTEFRVYVVVSIRKCDRGVAMLPELRGSPEIVQACAEWTPWSDPKRPFSLYLQDFLACIGQSDVPVYGSLDGRPLVSYQAVVRRCDWERIGDTTMTSFRAQRSAYRRLHGGKATPCLSLSLEPRFQVESMDRSRLESRQAIPVRGTFVHFGVGHALLQPRAADDICCAQRHAGSSDLARDLGRLSLDSSISVS